MFSSYCIRNRISKFLVLENLLVGRNLCKCRDWIINVKLVDYIDKKLFIRVLMVFVDEGK